MLHSLMVVGPLRPESHQELQNLALSVSHNCEDREASAFCKGFDLELGRASHPKKLTTVNPPLVSPLYRSYGKASRLRPGDESRRLSLYHRG